jgi:hypothetical protein
MAEIAAQGISPTGTQLALVAAAASQTFDRQHGQAILFVRNGSGASINVTLDSQAPVGAGQSQTDRVVAVAAGQDKVIGNIEKNFEDADGQVHISWSATTTVSVGVLV